MIEPTPKGAAEVFGDRLPLAERYAEHLASTGVEWGLIGPREVDRLWTRHILNCAVVEELLHEGDTVGDVGSGAGLPGLALALARPDVQFTLIEAMERRVDWLTMVVDDLGIDNVRIVRARAEELVDIEMFTAVTARAVKALPQLIEWCAPLLSPEGRLLAIKGDRAQQEIYKAKKAVKAHKMHSPTIKLAGEGILEQPTRVVEVIRR